MTFIPPPFSVLCPRTLNLDTIYSQKIGRYRFISDSGSPTENTVPVASSSNDPGHAPDRARESYTSNLEILLARAHCVEECNTDRGTQRDVIVKVMNEARTTLLSGDEEQIRQATLFLMGTLLHRYFRIIKECNSSYYFGYKDPGNSGLFIAIRKALNLPPYVYEKFRLNDLNILDAKTVLDCLKVFKDNMFSHDSSTQLPKYQGYPHLKADPNFEAYLDVIIKEHRIRGKSLYRQFNALNYIQSLAKSLERQRQRIDNLLELWVKDLKETFPEFSQLNSESLDQKVKTIEQHIEQKIAPGFERDIILDIIFIPKIGSLIGKKNYDEFIDEIKIACADTASHILFAGYIPLLESSDIDDRLKFVILGAVLNSTRIPAIPEDSSKSEALVLFRKFIEDNAKNPLMEFDLAFFAKSSKPVNLINDVIDPLQQSLTLSMQPRAIMTM